MVFPVADGKVRRIAGGICLAAYIYVAVFLAVHAKVA